jgi:transcriptional regulator with XRE-family HTH domain
MAIRRSTAVRRAGFARAQAVAKRLGIGLKEARRASGLTQGQLGDRAGVSQSEVARLESGRGWNAGVDTWAACAAAAGTQLAGFLERAPGAELPRDIEHLRRQDLVIRESAPGAWQPLPEALIPDGTPYPRSIDVHLTRKRRREIAVVEIWDLITDGGAAMRGLEGKVQAIRARMGPGWNVQGLLVVRGTRRNRDLIRGLAPLFAARYPASSDAWLRALRDPDAPLPAAGGLAWTDVHGDRLLAARPRPASCSP